MDMRTMLLLFVLMSSSFAAQVTHDWHWRDKQGNVLPDTPGRKVLRGFGANVLLVDDRVFFDHWRQPAHTVALSTIEKVHRDDNVSVVVIFAGCGLDVNHTCHLEGNFLVNPPKGKAREKRHTTQLYDGPVAQHLNASKGYLKISMEPTDPLGLYRVHVDVRDTVRNITLSLDTNFTLVEDNVSIPKKRPAAPNSPPKLSPKERVLAEWISSAYQKPGNAQDGEKILAILRSQAFFEKKTAMYPVAVFLSQRFRQEDAYLSSWEKEGKQLREPALEILLYALKEANTTQTKKLYNLLLPSIRKQAFRDFIQKHNPLPLLQQTISRPMQIDGLWASFMATGEKAYVEKIIELLGRSQKGLSKMMLVHSAEWSLLSNMQQHAKVLEIVKNYHAQNPKVNQALHKIIEEFSTQKDPQSSAKP